MNDNNIYNILGKLDALKPQAETAKQTAERIYESVEAQGSVMAGVNSVEARLNEKYMGFKKTVGALKKQDGIENPEALAASIGRKKYGKAAFQKAAAAGKKMGEAVEVATKAPAAAAQPGPIVLVHKAYRENIAKAKAALERFHHSEGIGRQLKLYPPSGKYGPDYYEFHLDKKPHNTVDMVERTLKSEGVKAGVVPGVQDDMEEGNEFSGALAQAKAQHKDEFEVDGKRYPVKENGLQRYTGIKKYGKDGFEALQKAGREGADEEEKGRIKDQYIKKEDVAEDRETLQTKKGTIYKGGKYGTEYDPSDEEKKDKPKHVPKKGQKGRPKKDKPASFDAPKGDIFGRTTGEVPKGKKGTKIKGKGNIDTVDESRKQVRNMVLESVNFKRMMDEANMTLDEMLECMNQDIKSYKATGDMTDRLRDFMHLHSHAKKQMEEAGPVPYEVPAVQRRAAGVPPLTPQAVQQQDAERSMHPGMTKLDAPKPAESMNQELDELAKLAGITDEGNAFTGKLANTPKGGEFELDGKTFKDTSTTLEEAMCNECGMYESKCTCQEGNLFTKHLKATPKGGEFEIDGKKYKDTSSLDEGTCPECHADPCECPKETTTLEDIAKLAGIAVEGKDYGDTKIPTPPAYDNTPDEEVQGEDVLLKGGDGEVAGGEKAMKPNKPTWKNADNPLAENEFNPVEAMGRKLMKAYEAIKVQK